MIVLINSKVFYSGVQLLTIIVYGCFGRLWSEMMKRVDVVFPQSFIFPSTLDRLHCHLSFTL